ncbi:HD domain-containing protein [Brevibacillus laterosporus]|uniref:Guanosine-3',5'-bis(Diphosphate) 3'-pyrophosphohydrolase n=1 Tax=Brevibacillus laterosporus TaxID=1465 RepID=A0AAP8U490_BRELA|nr:HD domain-containing protein [Brevibacillus laterosporus]MCR8981983.1 HD domain-containing protein [Brevibacillus laterosporus]MCZ0809138.1 HD domain-containing protein [Brevibacillus laterosporus]MCZ0827520.1 HD domain-containing protein [Brevibacillus laterosporus]MCZ0850070.1 HD domain-containing protein [Brevibacillus laterosporus]MED1664113.1 HD domain-containing protein [Brevibacillus laterosporus]
MNMAVEAVLLATKAHANQQDKGGQPYILHPLRVMMYMPSDEARAVAVLHDVLEDTDVTADDLREAGFPKEVVEAVMILTKNSKEDYDSYIKRVKQNQLARAVKIADIKDNLDLTRIAEPTEADVARIEKYKRALKELEADAEDNQKLKNPKENKPTSHIEQDGNTEEGTPNDAAKEDTPHEEAMADDKQHKEE